MCMFERILWHLLYIIIELRYQLFDLPVGRGSVFNSPCFCFLGKGTCGNLVHHLLIANTAGITLRALMINTSFEVNVKLIRPYNGYH